MQRNGDVIVGNWFDDKDQWAPLENPLKADAKRFVFTGESITCSLNMAPKELAKLPSRPSHTHYHEQLLLILEGKGECIVGDKHYPASAGSFFAIPHNVPHRFDMAKDTEDLWNLDVFCPSRKEYMKEEALKQKK